MMKAVAGGCRGTDKDGLTVGGGRVLGSGWSWRAGKGGNKANTRQGLVL
jgi:hypothetical protein